MHYTGERIIPSHDNIPAQGNFEMHELMYREFLVPAYDKNVLDIACGCGMGTKILAGKALKVHGYDIDAESIEFAKKYYNAENIKYEVGDICSIPEPDEFFDTVISIETVEHVADIKKVISEVHRVLKPKGLWCFSTPNGNRYPDHSIIKYHLKHYTEGELQELLDPMFSFYIRKMGLEPDSTAIVGELTFSDYSVFCLKR